MQRYGPCPIKLPGHRDSRVKALPLAAPWARLAIRVKRGWPLFADAAFSDRADHCSAAGSEAASEAGGAGTAEATPPGVGVATPPAAAEAGGEQLSWASQA